MLARFTIALDVPHGLDGLICFAGPDEEHDLAFKASLFSVDEVCSRSRTPGHATRRWAARTRRSHDDSSKGFEAIAVLELLLEDKAQG
ncbi:hypothetical protein [Sorangium sp. So ce1151]|uniref:hypothetical protein n=1 Tax=Sorangium sp. So ce1151 TaxID=3133332 RepID=UPI003F62C18A